jgi:hypothetical protein
MTRPDDVDSLTYAIEKLETRRNWLPSPEGRQVVLNIIDKLKELRGRILEQRAHLKMH